MTDKFDDEILEDSGQEDSLEGSDQSDLLSQEVEQSEDLCEPHLEELAGVDGNVPWQVGMAEVDAGPANLDEDDDAGEETEDAVKAKDISEEDDEDDDEVEIVAMTEEEAREADKKRRGTRSRDSRSSAPARDRKNSRSKTSKAKDSNSSESHEEDDFFASEDFSDAWNSNRHGDDDALGLPNQTKVDSAKEYFATEIIYRFDVLEDAIRKHLAGEYKIDLRGEGGGSWLVAIDDDLNVKSDYSGETEVALSMRHIDFVLLVNGDLNPQLSILSGKVKIKGNRQKALQLQHLFSGNIEH